MMFLLLGRMTTCSPGAALDRGQQVGGRRVHRLAAARRRWWTPRDRKMRRMPSPGARPRPRRTAPARGGGSPRRRCRRLPHPALLLDLLPEVGDPDLAGPAGLEGGLDGGTDVVGVDVAVPQAVAADDDDRVAEPGPHLAERRDGLVGRLEEVHDLVAQATGGRPLGPPRLARASRRTAPSTPAERVGGARERAGRRPRGGSASQQAGRTRHRRRRPRRPASRTGSRSGVRARAVGRLAAGRARGTATRSAPCGRPSRRPSAAALATVRMVPSTGSATAR